MLSDNFAPWWWLLVRDNKLTFGSFVNVVLVGLALSAGDETEKNGETNYTIQNRTSPPVSGALVYSLMVSFNV